MQKLFLEKLLTYFFSDHLFKQQTSRFKNLLYVFVIIKSVYWLIYYSMLFGNESMVYIQPGNAPGMGGLSFLLFYNSIQHLDLIFILAVLIISLLGLVVRKKYFLPNLLLWFFVLNLHNKIYSTLTGGDFLLNQFLFFNCFLTASFVWPGGWRADLRLFFHNLAVMAVIVQVCLVYFISAVAKLNDGDWLGGNAIFMVAQTRHFTLYSATGPEAGIFFVILNYLVLFYQLLFPALIWFQKIKLPMLIVGILMHVYIALVMGLVGFGAIMLLGYVYFWPQKRPIS